jgi:hypothetical protein
VSPAGLPSGSGYSAAAESAKGDQGADVRGLAGDYRDPAGAIQQDNFVDKVKDATSALPNNPLASVADQNKDVRGLAGKYRDPAGAVQQDKATGGWAFDELESVKTGGDVLRRLCLLCGQTGEIPSLR